MTAEQQGPRKKRPVLWDGEFVCTCGHRAPVEVLGRRGHRYDELEILDGPEDEQPTPEEREQFQLYIHESYTAEALGVLAVLACPKCGTRPGMKKELRKLALWLGVLLLMVAFTSGMLFTFGDRTASFGVLLAGGFTIVAKAYTFVAATLEAKDRVRFATLPRSAKDESASSG